jgi:branched-chain amino acid transport system substrate-binding protein
MTLLRRAIFLGATLMAALPVQAEIVIGQTAGFSGPVAAGVKETTDGAKLYFDAVNKAGGVNGEQLKLVSLDDKFDPKLSGENARKLVTDHKAVVLFLVRGTPHSQAVMPVLAEFKVPLVAPSTGAMLLHEPVNPWIFNVRATYQREAERAIEHLKTIGVSRIGILHVDDTFGADVLQGAKRGLAAAQLEPVFIEKFDRKVWDFSKTAPMAAASDVQAVLIVGSGQTVVDGVTALRKAGSRAQVITNSNNASSGFIKQLGANSRGVVVTQVFPNERSISSPLVKEAIEMAKASGLSGVTPAMLEGFTAAKVLVTALKRTSKPVTSEALRQTLDNLGRIDFGKLEMSYSPKDHTGLEFVDMSIIDASGRFLR